MSSIFNVYVILRFRCAQLVCIWCVVFFDTFCVSFSFVLFNFLFLKLQIMWINGVDRVDVTDNRVSWWGGSELFGTRRLRRRRVRKRSLHMSYWLHGSRLRHVPHAYLCRRSDAAYFYPRDAMLSRVLAMALRLSVCVCICVCYKSVFCRNGWMNRAGFGMGFSFHLSYTVLKGNSGIFKNKGTSLWKFIQNSGLRKFCFGISIVETCYRLNSTKSGRSERDKLDRRQLT